MTAFQCSIPAKLILFGEWAVLEGFPGIGISLQKNFLLTARSLSKPFLKITAGEKTITLDPSSLSGPKDPYFKFFLAGYEYFSPLSEKDLGWEVTLNRQWKTEEGLGSSSAALLAGALFSRKENISDPKGFWSCLVPHLRNCQNGKGSGFDLALQIYGGALLFQNKEPSQKIELKLPKELILIHSGKKWNTEQKLRQTAIDLDFCRKMTLITEEFLKTQNWIQALKKSQQLLIRSSFIPTDLARDMHDLEKEKLVTAWKSTGAGGGDSLLCWSENIPELKTACEKRGFWTTHPLVLGAAPEIEELPT